jgi:hypothetical protein
MGKIYCRKSNALTAKPEFFFGMKMLSNELQMNGATPLKQNASATAGYKNSFIKK